MLAEAHASIRELLAMLDAVTAERDHFRWQLQHAQGAAVCPCGTIYGTRYHVSCPGCGRG